MHAFLGKHGQKIVFFAVVTGMVFVVSNQNAPTSLQGNLGNYTIECGAELANVACGDVDALIECCDDGSDPVDGIEATGYISFSYAVGLTLATPSQTPLIFSRLALPGGTEWTVNDMYSGEGGHIGFAGGNVSWFEGYDPFTSLYDAGGDAATSMNDAIGVGDTIKIAGN